MEFPSPLPPSEDERNTEETFRRRTSIISRHLLPIHHHPTTIPSPCLAYSPPESSSKFDFNVQDMRRMLDGHDLYHRDRLYSLMAHDELFNPRKIGSRVFVSPDYNQSMEMQRELTWRRIQKLLSCGVFEGWMTENSPQAVLRMLAGLETLGNFDHSLAIKLGVHFFLWGGAVKFLGTKRHQKWLELTEKYVVKGCFAMTELGHGSNVRGIETITTYNEKTGEFIVNTPCESAQKYWIGGAANHATHTVVFSQLHVNGRNEGVHAFVAQIRDGNGDLCPNIQIADCGHKIGLNGVDNGRIWFNNLEIPRENLLNSVSDVTPEGQYVSSIKDPDQRFAAFLAPLTVGRINISISAIYQSKIGLSIATRYALSRRAFSSLPDEQETLLLDYPSYQRRLLPLIAKTYAMSVAGNDLKKIYAHKTEKDTKLIHLCSSAFKAMFTWHNMRTLQECREALGGQGLKTENRVGQLKGEYDVQSTFEGDNNILLQQVTKTLFGEYMMKKKQKKPFEGLGLQHMNGPRPVIPEELTPSILRDDQFQNDIFRLRERDLLDQFSGVVSQFTLQGKSKESAFIQSYQLVEDIARAFAELAMLESILGAESSCPKGSMKDVWSMLRSMYALICMEENPSFLHYGFLTAKNAHFVREELTKLCSELRPHALALVSSFGIHSAFLSPIAFDWIEANSLS